MKRIILTRFKESDQGTFSVGRAAGDLYYFAELPWRENKNSISCIPAGMYPCKIRKSPRFGQTFHVMFVNSRKFILIHKGNYAGDVAAGWRSDSQGCLVIGSRMGRLNGQDAVLASRLAFRRFMTAMGTESFWLRIIDARTD